MNNNEWLEREIKLLKKQNHEGGRNDVYSDYADAVADCLEQVMEVIGKQGHSGMSISILAQYINRACTRLPLTLLTGKGDEWGDWEEVGWEKMRQNLRYSALFQYEDGSLHDNNRVLLFDERDGNMWHSHIPDEIKASIPPIRFPYYPIHGEYVVNARSFYFDEDGNDVSEQKPGVYNRIFYDFISDKSGNKTPLGLWYSDGENGKLEKLEGIDTKLCKKEK